MIDTRARPGTGAVAHITGLGSLHMPRGFTRRGRTIMTAGAGAAHMGMVDAAGRLPGA